MSKAGIGTVVAGVILAFALPAYGQLPTTNDMEKVAPKKDEAKKAAPKKAPPKQAKKTEPATQADKPKQAPKTYSTGPTVLHDKQGNVIPTNPEAYPVDSAKAKR